MDDNNVKINYDTLWKFIIRPPRDEYKESSLRSAYFKFNKKKYQRKDYDIMSTEGYIMKGSLIEPFKECRPSIEMPVVLYLHGNSSSRIEGLNIAGELLKRDINLFVIDFVGCGLSEGEYISLGYHESDDVGNVIDFIEKIPGVGRIGLWGRSMGAATTMIYAHRDERIKAICMDSPFADFIRLAKELTLKQINLPGFLINTVLNIIRKTILGKNGLDIDKLKPIDSASKTFQPAIFIHAIYDELINVNHSIDLFNKYGGQVKSLKCCDKGGHNSKRNSMIINEIGNFFEEHLKKGINDKNKNNQIDNKIKDNLIKNEIEKFNSKEILKKNSLKEDIFNESEEPFNNIEYKIKKEEKFKKQINELEATLKSMKNIKKKNIDMNSTCYDSLNEEEKEN
jgi:pimeloyl-ACP methyl ester carboxylesterase